MTPIPRSQASLAAATPRKVPFDLATAQGMPDWRASLAWPVDLLPLRTATRRQLSAFLGLMGSLPDADHRDVALLGGMLLLPVLSSVVEAALVVQAEAATAIQVVGGPPELAYLRGDWPAGEPPPFTRQWLGPPRQDLRFRFARRLARAASWTPWWRVPTMLLAPTALAVSHNTLLRDCAACGDKRVAFRHGEGLLESIRARSGDVPPLVDTEPLVASVIDVLVQSVGLEQPYLQRLLQLAAIRARTFLAQAARDLARLDRWDQAPQALWSGTGGYYPARALGLAVLRHDGAVTRFAHGGGVGMIDMPEAVAFIELAASSRFVTATLDVAEIVKRQGVPDLVQPFRQIEVVGHTGDPMFAQMPRRSAKTRGARPRVVYVSSVLRGFRQYMPPTLPDVVYLDWQMRLATLLQELPLELVCKPHPEGLMYGQRHPLADVAPTSDAPFETLVDGADVFLFDYPQSTTFWESLCTDRPVVLIDLGTSPFNPAVELLIAERCCIIKATYDQDNRPQVDREALAGAILDGPAEADPAPFRRLLAGEER